MILLSNIESTHAVARSDALKKSLTFSSLFRPVTQDDNLFGISSLSYTFSGGTTDTINNVRLCQATDNTCSSCSTPFASISAGTPIPFASSGTTYGIRHASIAAYLSSTGSSAGSYSIGFYVQATNFNCSSSTAYCSTNSDPSSHVLCMHASNLQWN